MSEASFQQPDRRRPEPLWYQVEEAIRAIVKGGEWATGVALVSETFPAKHRGKALAFVQSSWAIGYGLAALVNMVVMPLWGWRGVLLAFTMMAFWLLIQFSRSLRTMREAAGAPVGTVASAVMVHSRLSEGMRLPQVLRLTRSLGNKLAEEPETFEWVDASGARLRAEMIGGRLARWALLRPDQGAGPGTDAEQSPP